MQDQELKKLLSETCPVRPGQEARAWAALKEQLYPSSPYRAAWNWLFYPTWRGAVIAVLALLFVPVAVTSLLSGLQPVSFATAESQSPGIYATSFYSKPAQAQVVWLKGMEPVTDEPTYLDPTTTVKKPDSSAPAGDPNSL